MDAVTAKQIFKILELSPKHVIDLSDESLRGLLSWNDANGDYDDLSRDDLIAALRVQIEGVKS